MNLEMFQFDISYLIPADFPASTETYLLTLQLLRQSSKSHLQGTQIKGRKNVVQESGTKDIITPTILESDNTLVRSRIKQGFHDEVVGTNREVHTTDSDGELGCSGIAGNFIELGGRGDGSRWVERTGNGSGNSY